MKHTKKLSGLLCLGVLLLFPPNGSSCGPFFPDTVFTYPNHPGAPLKWYAEGNLGVVLPRYVRAYLVMAYRYFAGNPLDQSEQRAAMAFWRWQFSNQWTPKEDDKDPTEEWLVARSQVMGRGEKHPTIETHRNVGYSEYSNCMADSFRAAAVTLRDRAQRYGAGTPAVLEWIKGQDTVFFNCASAEFIPEMVDDTSPSWLKADRHYQIAAAYFYSQSFDHAARDFDQIAIDTSSPWRSLAPYLAARSMIRKATLAATDEQKEEGMRDAETRLQQIIKDPNQGSIHHAARQMLAFVTFRTRPRERNAELARLLAGPRPDRDFEQDLIDYTWSLDQIIGEDPVDLPGARNDDPAYSGKLRQWKEQHYRELARPRVAHEMTDWILTFQQAGEAGRIHSIERWRRQHTLPWLVAALSKVDVGDKAADELLRAAEQVPSDSPAYTTIAYHRIRLLMMSGDNDKARALLREFLESQGPKLTRSALNMFLAERMKLATSYEDLLASAPRPVSEPGDGQYGRDGLPECEDKVCREFLYGSGLKEKTTLRFDPDAAAILNLRLPVQMMAQAAKGTALPEPLRGEMAVAAWTRAAMLDHHDIAAKLIPEIVNAYPVLREQMQGYEAAPLDDKKYAALFVVLHFPGMRPYVNAGGARSTRIEKIDNYRDNWWCADLGVQAETENYTKQDFDSNVVEAVIPKDAPSYPGFLSSEQVHAANVEWQTLAKSGSGDWYLARKTIAWAQEHPKDPRVAEALHYAVRSTRYGCGDRKTSRLSHQAFQLLHERYPNSKWAKQTPYWF